MAGPGCVLGLPATIGSQPYSLTATAVDPVEAGFIAHEDFISMLRRQPDLCLAVTETLATELYDARRQASALLDRFPVVGNKLK